VVHPGRVPSLAEPGDPDRRRVRSDGRSEDPDSSSGQKDRGVRSRGFRSGGGSVARRRSGRGGAPPEGRGGGGRKDEGPEGPGGGHVREDSVRMKRGPAAALAIAAFVVIVMGVGFVAAGAAGLGDDPVRLLPTLLALSLQFAFAAWLAIPSSID